MRPKRTFTMYIKPNMNRDADPFQFFLNTTSIAFTSLP